MWGRILFFYYLFCEAIGTAATPDLLCQPRVIVKMIVEKQMECRFAGETCPSATFVHHKIPHDQTRVWNRAAAVGSRRLTSWAMARPWGRIYQNTCTTDLKLMYFRCSGPSFLFCNYSHGLFFGNIVFKHPVAFIYTLFSLQCNSSLAIKNSCPLLHDMFRSRRAIIRCLVC
jgi:hypothetical protein